MVQGASIQEVYDMLGQLLQDKPHLADSILHVISQDFDKQLYDFGQATVVIAERADHQCYIEIQQEPWPIVKYL